jgi:hypothetical protein
VATFASTAFSINALTANFGAVKYNSKDKDLRWMKPKVGSYKLNMDSSFHSYGTRAMGVVLHN